MKDFSETHPSAVLSYCPKCGHKGFTFNGEKLFVCEACNFNYYINPAAAVSAIIELPDGRIAMGRRKFEPRKGMLDWPGGFVDMMERAEDALIREVREELGIEITQYEFLTTSPNEYPFKGISYFTCDIAFVCKLNTIPEFKATDDVSEVILVYPEDVDYNELCFPSTVNIMRKYLEARMGRE